MRYLIRSLKYFCQMTLLVVVIIGALMLFGLVSSDINVAFKEGWRSVGYIALMLACVAALYPRFGYGKREITIPGDFSEIHPEVIKAMDIRGYLLEKAEGENMTFRLKSTYGRIFHLWEDRITLERSALGFIAEGPSRDLVRIVNAFRNV